MTTPPSLPPNEKSLPEYTEEVRRAPVIRWYRTKVPSREMKAVYERSDLLGAVQTLGFLAIWGLTFTAALLSAIYLPWYATLGFIFLHGMVVSFFMNGVHELGHGTVFKTRWLNTFFVRVYAFLGWINHEHFQNSHQRHHRYTLHPPDDLEVVLPMRLVLRDLLERGIVMPHHLWGKIRGTARLSCGRFEGEWEQTMFPEGDEKARRPVIRWARALYAGHLGILLVSIAMGWWLLPVLTTFSPFYGGWLHMLCNATQHLGLCDHDPDYRVNSRTFTCSPLLGFLYWQMNYHIEHHMYAAVPCYRLAKLHRLIRHDLPPTPHGLLACWREIYGIQKRQEADPEYQYRPPLPASVTAEAVRSG
ncbi:MAG: fatty acid desaturase [Verrucomicrobiota bacterium]